MLPLIIIFGACGLAYASKRIYDDAGNGFVEVRAPVYGLLLVLFSIFLSANWIWRPQDKEK